MVGSITPLPVLTWIRERLSQEQGMKRGGRAEERAGIDRFFVTSPVHKKWLSRSRRPLNSPLTVPTDPGHTSPKVP